MLTENKFSKYLLYAIGEIVLVVIGILIALQINNWNENRKVEAIKRTNYLNLLQDLKTDSIHIHQKLEELNYGISLYDDYITTYKTPNLTMNDVLDNQNKLDFITTTIRFENSTITSLENTGDIKLIPSELRKKLTELKRNQDYLVESNNQWNTHYFDRIENAGIYGSQPHFQNRIKNQPLLRDELGIQENLDMVIWSIEIAMFYKKMNEENVSASLRNLQADITEIAESINHELNK
ncbi:MAG: hypothetical protein CMC08_10270 [Flavobacteriaceae bacterium]|mgnify:CR=1 FL=1|nr:hypothetical protein [Flavobacteriaceae bacterium]